MAWWDAQHQHRSPRASPRSRPRLIMGDAFPRLESTHTEMERERALLSPVFEDHPGPPTTPALVVHVEIRFTDPVIRSRYYRSYGSSSSFDPTDRICRGLVRRIERCSEEFLTRKDSGALELCKAGSYERKPQRFEMTFRIMRRGKGEWAERTYRSYQKQPLTVALTKEVILASHRMVGLFLRRHDDQFRWLDCPVSDPDYDGETTAHSRNGPPSLSSVPRSRFIEATQAFEFVPGYSIELSFRSRNLQRKTPIFERKLNVTSAQAAPLTLFMSEDMLGKALHVVNQGLDMKKRDLGNRVQNQARRDRPGSDNDALEIDLRISNNLGPVYTHVHRNVRSRLALFQDDEARDCDHFLDGIKNSLVRLGDGADASINATDDLEFKILELKGVGWTLREPARFALGPLASYGRRTIQAALDRMQTGIGDVIRGHNIAIHINAHKRGHLILDKAIVAHEKRGKPRETFASHDEAQAAFVSRLKARIQTDLDKVFEDSCSIDDIPEDDHDNFARPSTPTQTAHALSDAAVSPACSLLSTRSSPVTRSATVASPWQGLPRPRTQRVFSLSRRSTESVRSIDFLNPAEDPYTASEQSPMPVGGQVQSEDRRPLMVAAEIKPARRSFSLVSRRPPSAVRVSNASTLVEEQTANSDDRNPGVEDREIRGVKERSEESGGQLSMTSKQVEVTGARSRSLPVDASPPSLDIGGTSSRPTNQPDITPQHDNNKHAPSTSCNNEQSKMDSPDTFVDAKEVISPVSEEITEGLLSNGPAEEHHPKSDDEFSTAPTTPELSTGGSSPRHSILITPSCLRTNSGTTPPRLLGSYPESEPEEPEIGLQSQVTKTPSPKEGHDHHATEECPIGQLSMDLPPRAIAAPELEADTMPASTPIASTTSGPYLASEAQACDEKLGAEVDAESDSCSQNPDFPTPEVRASGPNERPDQGPDSGDSDSGDVLGSDRGPEMPTESHVSEVARDKLGTGPTAEAKCVEDVACRDFPCDAQSEPLPSGSDQEDGAEPDAVPSGPDVVNETFIQGSEVLPRDDGHKGTDERQVPASSDATNVTEGQPGSDDVSDGPGLVPEAYRKEPSVVEDPADETDNIYGDSHINAQTSEIAVEDRVDENDGPVSCAEAVHIEPEGQVLDIAVETAADKHPIAEDSVEIETDLSEPVPAPDNAPEEPEQLDSQTKAPTCVGAEKFDDVADKSEPLATHAGNDDAVGVSGQDVVPEEHVTSPGPGDGRLSKGEESNLEQDVTCASEQDVTYTSEQDVTYTSEQDVTYTSEQDVTETLEQDVTPPPEHDVIKTPEQDVIQPAVQDVAEAAIGSRKDSAICLSETKSETDASADVGILPEVFEEDLADELVVQPDDNVNGISGSEREILEPEICKERPATVYVPSQELSEGVAEGKAETSKWDIIAVELAQELEVQGDDIGRGEHSSLGQETLPQAEVVAKIGESDDDMLNDAGATPEDEGGKIEAQGSVSVEPETPQPQLHDEQSAQREPIVTPAISVEGVTVPLPGVSAPPAEGEKPDTPASITTAPVDLPPPESPESAPQPEKKEKPHLAPIPDLTKLVRTPFSSTTNDRETLIPPSTTTHTRKQVDTRHTATDSQRHPHIPAAHTSDPQRLIAGYRPQTAGYLGLRGEPRFFEVGLRGALGDVHSRRGSLPVPHHVIDQELPSAPILGAGGSSWGTKGAWSRRMMGLGGGLNRGNLVGEVGEGDGAVLPRMAMLLAGAAVLGGLMMGAE
ncbi:hypothetical protein BT67DRAFT_416259 [Trichocladium antarcticum]|uniref:Pt repeat family protein n=1 Tax=Trichocladium antarcticum TaxID=1450529 RepID=A0AAN6UP41_9PEZI|nr:hypothetical protein BT67DRAFT_416259 [Trichocladium antarcticum]